MMLLNTHSVRKVTRASSLRVTNYVKRLLAVALVTTLALLGTASIASATALTAPTATISSTTSVTVSFSADPAWTWVAGNLYTVATSGSGGQACTVAEPDPASSASLSCTVSALTAGTAYTFTLSETGSTATSTNSGSSNSVTPGAPLATPSALGASTTSATVTFSADSSWTAATGDSYTVTSTPGALTCSVANATSTLAGSQSCTVSGLTSGTAYTFVVTETGSGTASTSVASASSNSVIPGGPLATPSAIAIGTNAAAVTFNADSSWTAATGDSYTVTSTPGALTCSVANATSTLAGSQSCTVSGLTSGTAYTFVAAENGTGTAQTSTPSAPSNSLTPGGALATPTAVRASTTSATVTFSADSSWTAATGDAYTVTSTPGGFTCSVANVTSTLTGTQSCTVSGLTSGTAYTFVVTETGSGTIITSAASAASNSVTPGTGLATPTAVATSSTSSTVTFSADSAWTWVSGNLYTVAASGTGGQACTVAEPDPASGASLSCTVSALVTGVTYTFTVRETGTSSTSSASLPSNAVRSLQPLLTPTVAVVSPTSVMVTFSADPSWTAGTGDAYSVTSTPGSLTCSVANATTTLTGSQNCTVSGLTTGTSYTFVVSETGFAVLAQSAPSLASNSLTLGSQPATPTASWAASGAALISFGADGVATTYTVTAHTALSPFSVVGTCVVTNAVAIPKGALSCTVTGLTNGVGYTFSVAPSGNATTSLPSLNSTIFSASATAAPAAPAIVSATGAIKSVVVNWTAPSNTGGVAITSYVVTATAGSSIFTCGTLSATATTCTLKGLLPATTYAITVAAVNAVGTSPVATSSAKTATIAAGPFAKGARGVAFVGRSVIMKILGAHFYGQPRFTSNELGTRVAVLRDTGSLLMIRVATFGHAKGWHTFTIRFANGKTCRANYDVK